MNPDQQKSRSSIYKKKRPADNMENRVGDNKQVPDNQSVPPPDTENCNLKKIALDFFEKFKNIPDAANMECMDILEVILQNDKQPDPQYRTVYLYILDQEIAKTESFLKKMKTKREFVRDAEWTFVKIDGNTYFHKKYDAFAYLPNDLQSPIYMWDGRMWKKLVSDSSCLSEILDF
jgi:hypothetical protein